MAKALGLIGNFTGKLGNTVGYNLKDSNNKQTQGVRVYQPVVKNPKTSGQAEQRAKLAPINATYRALKMIIDRGQEGLAYGNKSRLAWLSDAMKAFNGGWFEKGAAITAPALVPLTKGSLNVPFNDLTEGTNVFIRLTSTPATTPTTIGALSIALIDSYPSLQNGDQITGVKLQGTTDGFITLVDSIVLDTTSSEAIPSSIGIVENEVAFFNNGEDVLSGAIIVSREGSNGAHLRTTTSLVAMDAYRQTLLEEAAKAAAIASYMAAGANTDWAEESIM